ncbi:MAG: UDP-N-acetylglucosamine--LPS N-acetylglucosamine transferase, partial [Verrucomicrobiota bacterium]
MKKPRVLLLTASYGHGHNTAAYSLRDALEKQGAEAEVCDFFESEYPWLHPKVRWAYNQAIINFPWLWKIIYTLYDH